MIISPPRVEPSGSLSPRSLPPRKQHRPLNNECSGYSAVGSFMGRVLLAEGLPPCTDVRKRVGCWSCCKPARLPQGRPNRAPRLSQVVEVGSVPRCPPLWACCLAILPCPVRPNAQEDLFGSLSASLSLVPARSRAPARRQTHSPARVCHRGHRPRSSSLAQSPASLPGAFVTSMHSFPLPPLLAVAPLRSPVFSF